MFLKRFSVYFVQLKRNKTHKLYINDRDNLYYNFIDDLVMIKLNLIFVIGTTKLDMKLFIHLNYLSVYS